MKSSTLFVREADPAMLAAGHTKSRQGQWKVIEHYPYNRAHTPSSNLHSNVEDMSRWVLVQLNRGELDHQRILSRSQLESMWKPVAEVKPPSEKIGLCWFLDESKGERLVKYFGSDDGFLTAIGLFPEKRIGIIILINSDNAPLRYIWGQVIAVALGRRQDVDLQ
jgi:CubicO group peptidase (beta-lactamase class C family)